MVAAEVTVIVVSHAFDYLPDRTVRVLVMQRGKIVLNQQCSPREVEKAIRNAGNGTNNA